MKIVIIGSGNVATVLGKKIKASGHHVLQVLGRNEAAVKELAAELGSAGSTNVSALDHSADLYIAALADQALPQLYQWLQLEKKTVVHTAASVSKDVLRQVSRNYGVLYPLQTFRKQQREIPEIPFLVDGNTADDLALIQDFAQTLSDRVMVAGDELRLRVHVAAVFVSNFTNHLYTLAEGFCRKENVEFGLLQPLIEQTAVRLRELSPKDSQTGPALRGDDVTIGKHLEVLNAHPVLKEIYDQFTRSIRQ